MGNVISRPAIDLFSAKVELEHNTNDLVEVADFDIQLRQAEQFSSTGLPDVDSDPDAEIADQHARRKTEDRDATPDISVPVVFTNVLQSLKAAGGSARAQSTEFASPTNSRPDDSTAYQIVPSQITDGGDPITNSTFRAALIEEFASLSATELTSSVAVDELHRQTGSELTEIAHLGGETNSSPDSLQFLFETPESSSPSTADIPLEFSGDSSESPGQDHANHEKQQIHTPDFAQSAKGFDGELMFVTGDGTVSLVATGSDVTTGVVRTVQWQTNAVAQQLLQQTTRAITSHVRNDGTSQTISLELHPAELGQLKIHIERNKNRLTARIVASEIGAEDLLNREREQLLQTLRNLGLGDAEVEILHRKEWEQDTHQDREFSTERDRGSQNESSTRKTVVKHYYRPGVNFVA